MNTAIFIDGNSLLHRAFYALPTTMKTSDGRYTNAVYGFINMLLALKEKYEPEYLAVAFDIKKHTFRNDIYTDYKAGRKPTPPELASQFPLIRSVLNNIGIKFIELEGYEGDDILGTLASKLSSKDILTYIVTGDRDALQLITDKCHVLMTKKGVSELEEYDEVHLKEVYSLAPLQIIDLKSLMGDSSDNIPGVAGVGEKTALKLLLQYPSLEDIYINLDSLPKNKLHEKLVNNRDNAFMSKELATIIRDAPIDFNIDELKFNGFDDKALYDTLKDLEFTSLIKKLGIKSSDNTALLIKEVTNPDELSSFICNTVNSKKLSLYINADNVYLSEGKEEYHVALSRDLFGSGLTSEFVFSALSDVLADNSVKKYMHNAKSIYHMLDEYEVRVAGLVHDAEIGEYILNPTRKKLDLLSLKQGYDIEGYALAIIKISEEQRKKIEKNALTEVFDNIEMPLIDVLFEMEKTGFTVDRKRLKELADIYAERISNITDKIYELAGEKFNISSTKQLGEILFIKLGLPAKKKTKTGYSTDIEVLESLADMHPIINLIIEYRQLTKLKSTYIDGFINVTTDADAHIHSTFNQTVTATGRISSTEPNLQNIPIRSELSHDIREVFIPSNEANYIISADYSQIELRVLAHIADDKNMIDAFLNGEDIHTRTAAEVFDVSKQEVTSQMRSSAKAVNFGIVYGISDFGLAKNLGIPRFKAAEYIKKYLKEFLGVDRYMKDIVEQAKSCGYVRTLFGRIRYIDELASSNYNTRAFGERAAMNTPIQGTAADIIKIAMIAVFNILKQKGMRSKLILQVHDELVIDAVPDEVEEIKNILINEMENAFSLKVPLKVDISIDKTF